MTMPPFLTVDEMSFTAATNDAPTESRVFFSPAISMSKISFARFSQGEDFRPETLDA